MTEKYQEIALKIAYKLTEDNTGEIKGIIGFVDLVCRIVEQSCKTVSKKKKLSPEFKKELACNLMVSILDVLNSKQLIDGQTFFLIRDNITGENITFIKESIDEVINIWNIHKNSINKLLLFCGLRKKKKLRV